LRSGALTCAVTFSLQEPDRLAAGAYSAEVDLRLRIE
jgi:hypothetical protein